MTNEWFYPSSAAVSVPSLSNTADMLTQPRLTPCSHSESDNNPTEDYHHGFMNYCPMSLLTAALLLRFRAPHPTKKPQNKQKKTLRTHVSFDFIEFVFGCCFDEEHSE